MASTRKPGVTCGIALTKQRLNPAEAAELDELLADASLSGPAIARALRGLGHEITDGTIYRHRSGGCLCR